MKVLYPGDARQFTRITSDSLNKLTRDNLIEHYKKYFVPSGELAGIVGDITPQRRRGLAGKGAGRLEGRAGRADIKLPVNPPIAEKKVYLISRPGSVQTNLTLANRAIDRTNPDYIACLVMNQVLGSGPAARLFRIIREEKGLHLRREFQLRRIASTCSISAHPCGADGSHRTGTGRPAEGIQRNSRRSGAQRRTGRRQAHAGGEFRAGPGESRGRAAALDAAARIRAARRLLGHLLGEGMAPSQPKTWRA